MVMTGMKPPVLEFGDKLVDGVFAFSPWLDCLIRSGSRQSDLSRLRLWETKVDNSHGFDVDADVDLYRQDAVEFLSKLSSAFSTTVLDPSSPATWLTLRSGVIACNRLVTEPWFDVAPESLRDDVLNVGYAISALGRICDPIERQRQLNDLTHVTEQDWFAKGLPFLLSCVIGQGSAWLAYIDRMGEVVCETSGIDWWRLRDERAAQRLTRFKGLFKKIRKFDDDATNAAFVALCEDVAARFDWVQMYSWASVRGSKEPTVADRKLFKRAVSGEMPFPNDKTPDMRAYCRLFGISSVGCTCELPRVVEVEVRKHRIETALEEGRKKRQELEERRMKRAAAIDDPSVS